MSGSVGITGGAFSISAEFDELARFAGRLDELARVLGQIGVQLVRAAGNVDLIEAGVLDPVGAAQVGFELAAAALTGAAAAGEAAALALGLRGAERAYRAADAVRTELEPVLAGMAAIPALARAGVGLPGAVLTGHPEQLQRLLTADPALADIAVDGLGLGLGGRLPVPWGRSGSQRALGELAPLYRDGTAIVTRPAGWPVDDGAGPPRSAGDLIRSLSVRNRADDGGGMIDIRFVGQPDGSRAVIVDLPGTTRWNADPRASTAQVSDLSTNLRALAGRSSVYERGVIDALRQAGVRGDEPIMLVGHSQGGLIAARLAGQLRRQAGFNVTHLVTAGAPIGAASIPAGVSVLALENRGDVVPHLDGRSNPARPNWITAHIDHGEDAVGARHGMTAYQAGAADLDRSRDPSIRAWSADAAAFLDGRSVSTEVFQIRRAP